MKEDKFSYSDLFLNKEKSYLDLDRNVNATKGLIFSESLSVPASKPLKSMRVQWTKAKTLDGLIRQILTQMITIIMTMEKEAFIFCPRITCFSWVFQ